MKFLGLTIILLAFVWWGFEFAFTTQLFYCFYKDGFICGLSNYSPFPLYIGIGLFILGVLKK